MGRTQGISASRVDPCETLRRALCASFAGWLGFLPTARRKQHQNREARTLTNANRNATDHIQKIYGRPTVFWHTRLPNTPKDREE